MGGLCDYDHAGLLMGDSHVPTVLEERQILETSRSFRDDSLRLGDRHTSTDNRGLSVSFRGSYTTGVLSSVCNSLSDAIFFKGSRFVAMNEIMPTLGRWLLLPYSPNSGGAGLG